RKEKVKNKCLNKNITSYGLGKTQVYTRLGNHVKSKSSVSKGHNLKPLKRENKRNEPLLKAHSLAQIKITLLKVFPSMLLVVAILEIWNIEVLRQVLVKKFFITVQ